MIILPKKTVIHSLSALNALVTANAITDDTTKIINIDK